MNNLITICKTVLIVTIAGYFFSACTPVSTVNLKSSTMEEIAAADAIKKKIEIYEKSNRGLFKTAEQAFNNGYVDDAIKLFSDFVENHPESAMADDAYLRLGELYLQEGNSDEAINNFEKIITDYVGSDLMIEAKHKLSLTYFSKGFYNDAIQALKSLMTMPMGKTRKVAVTATIADSYFNLGRKMEALSWYEKALNEDPPEVTKNKIKKKAMSTISNYLNINELEELASRQAGTFVGDYAKYAIIINMVDEEKYDDAKKEAGKLVRETQIASMKIKGEEILDVIDQRMSVNANTIGCILPLSGKFAVYGKKLLNGVQLAAGIIGGINLVIKDSKGDPEEASKAVEELVDQDKVIAIVGPLISSVAEKAAETAQRRGVPMMALSKRAGIPETGDYIFRNFLTNAQQTRTLANHAVKELGIKRFAILYPKDSYGEELMNLFWNDVTLLGGEVVGIEGYNPDQYDFGIEIKKLIGMDGVDKKKEKKKEPSKRIWPVIDFEAIFIPDGYEKVGLMSSQLVYNDIDEIQLLGTNSWHSTKLIDIGTKYVDGARFVSGFYLDSTRASTTEFSKEFEESFEEQPGIMEAMAYDATRMITEAIRGLKAKSRVEMRDALLSIEGFNGTTGKTSVSETGDVEKRLFVLTVKNNEIVEVIEPEKAGENSKALTTEEMPLVLPQNIQE